jgi:hypothetical protein
MIDLYAMGSPNVVKIYIALEEMGRGPFLGGQSYSSPAIVTPPNTECAHGAKAADRNDWLCSESLGSPTSRSEDAWLIARSFAARMAI